MTWPIWCCVASLYCLQNSMMLTPCCPRAVPTGGAGVACPALIWSLTTARTFFLGAGMLPYLLRGPSGLRPPASCGGLDPCDLVEAELDRRLSVEDVHHHLDLRLVDVDLIDGAVEVGEGPGDDPHHIPLLELEAELRLGLLLLHHEDLLDL